MRYHTWPPRLFRADFGSAQTGPSAEPDSLAAGTDERRSGVPFPHLEHFRAHDATRTPPTLLPRYSHEVTMRNDEIGTWSGLTHSTPQFRKNIHQLQAANAAVARHVASVEPPSTTPNARVNSISSSTPAAISPSGDVSGLPLNPGSGSPGAANLFADSGLGGQAAQLTCRSLNVAPHVFAVRRSFSGAAGLVCPSPKPACSESRFHREWLRVAWPPCVPRYPAPLSHGSRRASAPRQWEKAPWRRTRPRPKVA